MDDAHCTYRWHVTGRLVGSTCKQDNSTMSRCGFGGGDEEEEEESVSCILADAKLWIIVYRITFVGRSVWLKISTRPVLTIEEPTINFIFNHHMETSLKCTQAIPRALSLSGHAVFILSTNLNPSDSNPYGTTTPSSDAPSHRTTPFQTAATL